MDEDVQRRSDLLLLLFNLPLQGQSGRPLREEQRGGGRQTLVGVDDLGPDLV